MKTKKTPTRAKAAAIVELSELAPVAKPMSRRQTLIDLMRAEGGATAADLGGAVGWQVHSIRGFISGTLKKDASLKVETQRVDGVTRYSITDQTAAGA